MIPLVRALTDDPCYRSLLHHHLLRRRRRLLLLPKPTPLRKKRLLRRLRPRHHRRRLHRSLKWHRCPCPSLRHPLRRRLHWRVRVFYEDAVLSPAHVPPARRTPGARGAPASEKGEEGEEDAKTQEGESYFHLPLDLFSTNAPTRPQEEREERKEAKVGLGLLGVDFWEEDEDVIEKESS